MSLPLTTAVRHELLSTDGVTKFAQSRRFTSIFSEGDPAEALYFLETGLVKLYKRDHDNKEIIIQIFGPGELFGEQALGPAHSRTVSAEMLQEGSVYAIPRNIFAKFCDEHAGFWRQFSDLVLSRERELQKKIELLCLQDVEYRIMYYLAELASLFGGRNGHEYMLPLSQGELASLIGATRETTSTTLNTLARTGLIRLGRRQLIVPQLDGLRNTLKDRLSKAAAK